MGDFITALMSALSADAFWDALAPAAPLIGVLILVSFGYFVLRRVIRGAGQAKPKI